MEISKATQLKTAIITGVFGQDGIFLVKILKRKNYKIFGISHKNPSSPLQNQVFNNLDGFLACDIRETSKIIEYMKFIKPDEFYNFAGLSSPSESFKYPERYLDVNAVAVENLVSSLSKENGLSSLRFYQASSSEIFGLSQESPQNELTEYSPATPYGKSKMIATKICQEMRETRNLHLSCGILYNHESEYRDPKFVSRKISKGFARVKLKLQNQIELGNLDSRRDWGYAEDYVYAMWLMLQQDSPGDFIISSGNQHSVKEFLIETFSVSGLPGIFSDYVKFDPNQLRPQDPNFLVGDSSLAKLKLGWEPTTTFRELVQKMYSHDLLEENTNL